MSLTLDASRFNALIADYVSELGLEAKDVIRTQSRLFLQTAIRLTPPRTLAQGRKAAARDVRKAVAPISADDFKSEAIKRLINRQDKAALTAALPNIRKGWQLVDFSPELHTGARGRDGKVKRSWHRATLDVKAWKKYVKEIQARVGRLKAAWVPALRAVGGTAPAWVAKHSAPSGGYNNNLDASNPSFTAISFGKGVANYARIYRDTLRARAHAMQRDLARKIRLLNEQFNSKG